MILNELQPDPYLFENDDEKKTQTKDQTKTSFNLPPKGGDLTKPEQKTKKTSPKIKKASKASTQQRVRNIRQLERTPRIDTLDFTDNELEQDKELTPDQTYGYEPEPTEPEDLPATRNTLPAEKGTEVLAGIDPEWIGLTDLPGYMQQAIRMMGRRVFKSFTSANLEEMSVVSTLTHPDREVLGVANWITHNGSEVDGFELEFQNIEDYGAEGKLYTAGDNDFLLIEDFAGKYIYTWPAKTRIGN